MEGTIDKDSFSGESKNYFSCALFLITTSMYPLGGFLFVCLFCYGMKSFAVTHFIFTS